MTDLLERLKERTSPAHEAKRPPLFNHPPLWYMKPDGDIVQLQGDPQNRAYFQDKGYALLRPEEVAEWVSNIRPERIAEQRKKAQLVNTLRRLATKNPGIELALEDDNTVAELEEMLEEMGRVTGAPVKLIARSHIRDTDDDLPSGVEVGHNHAEFQNKLDRARAQGKAA